ncbi:MAG: GNAT family N-acetyltransferase [Pseudomonadota bacterium]
MRPEIVVCRLGVDDVAPYRDLRLLGLKTEPAAFGGAFEEAQDQPDTYWRQALQSNRLHYGAFAGEKLVGIANFEQFHGQKLKHRAGVYGVFVHPDFGGMGIGVQLLTRIADDARARGITQLHLGVGVDNKPARRLYSKLGFEPYGHEPSAIRLADRDIDELLMIKFLA